MTLREWIIWSGFVTVAVIAVLMLAGCGTTRVAKVDYQPVRTEVAVSCVPANLGPAPKVHTPAELAALSGPERYIAIASDYLVLFERALQTESVITGCR